MKAFKGVGVCGAYAIGSVRIYKKNSVMVCRRRISEPERELERLEAAKERAARELMQICKKARREVGDTGAQIFEKEE